MSWSPKNENVLKWCGSNSFNDAFERCVFAGTFDIADAIISMNVMDGPEITISILDKWAISWERPDIREYLKGVKLRMGYE